MPGLTRVPTHPPAPSGVHDLAVAVAAHRLGATAVGLVHLGEAAPAAPVPTVRGDRPLPVRTAPTVVSRAVVGADDLAALPETVARVPAGALPVVTTAWTVARLAPADRLRLLRLLDVAATDRAVVWVSVEGVGVAPGVPTLGDRPASGHSLVGLAVLAHGSLTVETVARCWARGRWLAWLADDVPGPLV